MRARLAAEIVVLWHEHARAERRALWVADDGHPDVYVAVDQGASNGGTSTLPPSSVAFAAVASASSVANVTLQCAGVSGWSSPIRMMLATSNAQSEGRSAGPSTRGGELAHRFEIYFSIVQRKVLSPNDFESTAEVARTLSAFERRWNEVAEPFEWAFTRDDLADLMDRLAPHEPALRLAA